MNCGNKLINTKTSTSPKDITEQSQTIFKYNTVQKQEDVDQQDSLIYENTYNQQNQSNNNINQQYSLFIGHKYWLITVLLSLFIYGLGYVYLKLYKRFIIALVTGMICSIINMYTNTLLFVIIWLIYILYDGYMCTEAINKNDKLPLFLFKFNII